MPVVPPFEAAHRRVLVRHTADFPVCSFAFVMATGIVSIAARQLGLSQLSLLLFLLNAVVFSALWLLTLLRLVHRPLACLADLQDHQRGPSLLTVVAGTGVLGTQLSLLTPYQSLAAALWLGGLGLWAGITYALFAAATIRAAKPPPHASLNGNWLLAVVAPESLAVLGTHVAGVFATSAMADAAALCLFLLGGFFYLIIVTLILYRWLFEQMSPDQSTPSYWTNMGAAAITALAGSRLVSVVGTNPALADIRGLIIGAMILLWMVATWWIPLLLAAMIWRHLVGGVPLVYRLEYWSIVFPIGMCTAASWTLSHAIEADFLLVIPRIFVWVAVTEWGATFIGMTLHIATLLRQRGNVLLMRVDD
jgi:tellurite resistance protein TehA-like permease